VLTTALRRMLFCWP